jgi:hypothetical protein
MRLSAPPGQVNSKLARSDLSTTVSGIAVGSYGGPLSGERGTSLRPVPPGASKHKDVRYFDIQEGDELDEPQMANWVKQAAALPGWVP